MNFQPTVIPSSEDHINISSIFSGIERNVLSKDFKGGRISNVFGSTELDFTHADMTGTATLDISQTFGAITITIPDDWHIETDMSQLFAVVDDYRDNKYQTRNSEKILLIKGTSVCASLEIHNTMSI